MITDLTRTEPRTPCAAPCLALAAEANGASFGHEGQPRPDPQSAQPRVGLVDDDEQFHLFFRDLASQGKFKLSSSSHSGAEALQRLPEDRPDIIVMDIRLPDMSGIDCTAKLKAILPATPIIILTGFPESRTFFRCLMEGATGFLVKPVLEGEFMSAFDGVLKGEFVLAKQAVPYLIHLVRQVGQVNQGNLLTRREEEILACLFEGMQDKEIASALGIGTSTVHTHMSRLFEKLGVHSRREIIAKYLALT